MRFKLMHGAPPLPRRPVIKLNDYNKLTENDDLFIHRWMQQRCEFYDSIQVSDCPYVGNYSGVDNYSGGDMRRHVWC